MRILISGTMYPPELNGQSVFTANLAEGMAARGHRVRVLVPGAGRQITYSMRNNVEVVELPSLHLHIAHQELNLSLFTERPVAEQFDDFRPDVVHVQDPSPLCQSIIHEAHRRGVPALATHHTGPEITAPYFSLASARVKNAIAWIVWKMLLLFLNNADQVTVPSNSSVAMLDQKGLRKSAVPISCGVRLDNFHPDERFQALPACEEVRERYGLSPDKTLLLYVGRIDIEKRVDVLVKAMAYLASDNVELAIAGTGGMEASVKHQIAEFHLERRVHLLGGVPHEELPALLNCADVFAMPGDVKSFSIATLEAMACGKPVLAANSSALPELVTHGVNGCLFTPGDPQDAASQIEQLIQNRDQWETMGQVSMERARRHRLDAVMGKYERIYQASVASKAQPVVAPATPRPLAGLSLNLHYPEFNRRMAFRPLSFLVIFGFLLCSMLFSADSTYAAPNLPNQDLKTINLTNITKLLVISPDDDSSIKSTGGLIRAVIDQGGRVQILVLPDSAQSETDSNATGTTPGGKQTSRALSSALLDLGIPQEMVDYFNEPAAAPAAGQSDSGKKLSGAGNIAAHLSLASLGLTEKNFMRQLGAILKDFKPDTVLVPDTQKQGSTSTSIDDLTQFALAAGYLDENNSSFPMLFAYLVKDNQTDETSPDVNSVPAEVVDGQASGWYRFPASQVQSVPSSDSTAVTATPPASQGDSELFYQVPVITRDLLDKKTAEPLTLAKVWDNNPVVIRQLRVEDSTCYALQVAGSTTNPTDSDGHILGACMQKQQVAGDRTAYSLGFWNSGSSGMDVWRLVLMANKK